MTLPAAISRHFRMLVAGVACAVTLVSLQPARAAPQDEVQRYLIAARRLFQNADNERALEQLQRAKKLSRGLEDDVVFALYEGLILADLGRTDESRSAFRTALLLKPDASLPVKVSPKVNAQFEELRGKVQQELARVQAQQDAERPASVAEQAPVDPPPAAQPERAAPRAEPTVVAQTAPARTDTPRASPKKARSAEVAIPVAPSPEPAHPRAIPWTPIAVTGAAVLVASAGAIFGQMSRDSYRTAESSTFQDDRVRAMDAADRNATVANVLFAAAGAIGVGAVVTWVW